MDLEQNSLKFNRNCYGFWRGIYLVGSNKRITEFSTKVWNTKKVRPKGNDGRPSQKE